MRGRRLLHAESGDDVVEGDDGSAPRYCCSRGEEEGEGGDGKVRKTLLEEGEAAAQPLKPCKSAAQKLASHS